MPIKDCKRILAQISSERDAIKKEMRNYPDGKLMIVFDHGSYKKILISAGKDKSKTRKGIGKNKTLVHRLARKAFLQEKLRRVNTNIAILNSAVRSMVSVEDYEIVSVMPKNYDQLPKDYLLTSAVRRNAGFCPNPSLDPSVPVKKVRLWVGDMTPSEWGARTYRQNSLYLENKNITLTNGLKVRSKSEAGILGLFAQHGLIYHYDELVAFKRPEDLRSLENSYSMWSGAPDMRGDSMGKTVLRSPDFILIRSDGKLIYYEHAGLVNDPEYLADLQIKLAIYKANGIVPWDNLILTFDDPDGGINLQLVEAQLRDKGLI